MCSNYNLSVGKIIFVQKDGFFPLPEWPNDLSD